MDRFPVQLLAMRHAAGKRRRALARAVLAFGDLASIAHDARWIPSHADWQAAYKQATALAALGIRMVDVRRLPRCFHAADPPLVLFVRGDVGLLERDAVGIVGSRRASRDAAAWAEELAAQQAQRGVLIVSGGALGIDAAAHRGALRAGQPTVAYLGVAADRVYPATNRPLFAEILRRGGALVSEHPPGAQCFGWDHRGRNRFIAAHARAVYVAEADVMSGSLGTAAWAYRLGKQVDVSPPGVGRLRAGLTELLQTKRAQVITSAQGLDAVRPQG